MGYDTSNSLLKIELTVLYYRKVKQVIKIDI